MTRGEGSLGIPKGLKMLLLVGLDGAAAAPGLLVCTTWFAIKLKIFLSEKFFLCVRIYGMLNISQ